MSPAVTHSFDRSITCAPGGMAICAPIDLILPCSTSMTWSGELRPRAGSTIAPARIAMICGKAGATSINNNPVTIVLINLLSFCRVNSTAVATATDSPPRGDEQRAGRHSQLPL